MSGFGRVGHNHIMQMTAVQNSQKEKLGVSVAHFFFFFLIFSSYEDVKTKLLQTSHLIPDVVLEENPMRLKLKYKSL